MLLTVTPVRPRFNVVLPLPALLNVAVSPLPGTGALQFVPVDQEELVVPFQVALAARSASAEPKAIRKAKNKVRRAGDEIRRGRQAKFGSV